MLQYRWQSTQLLEPQNVINRWIIQWHLDSSGGVAPSIAASPQEAKRQQTGVFQFQTFQK